MSLFYTKPLLDELVARAIADYPRETCGMILGLGPDELESGPARRHIALAILPLANTHPGDRNHLFAISRADYERAEAEAARAGLTILGVYHSHPDSPPRPSDEDSTYAFPGWIYLIQTIRGAREAERAAWLRGDSAWSEMPIIIADGASQI